MNKTNMLFSFLLISFVSFGQFSNVGYIAADATGTYGDSKMNSLVNATDGTTVTVHNIKKGVDPFGNVTRNVQILKVDPTGGVIWSLEFGEAPYDDEINSICQTDDGGYMLVGSRGKIENAYREWILRLTSDGSILWERLYYDEYNSELLVVSRTSEAAENYFIAGRRSCTASLISDGHITAMKINGDGEIFWHNEYKEEDFPNGSTSKTNFVTSMVAHPRTTGFVLAGKNSASSEFRGEDNPAGNSSESNLFTIGIRLNGNIFTQYRTYDVQSGVLGKGGSETDPFINVGIDDTGFVMGFGLGGKFGDGPDGSVDNNGSIVFMPLQNNLRTNYALLFNPRREEGMRATSVHPDPVGFYALGCTANRQENTLYTTDSDRVSFLKLDPAGNSIGYVTFDSGSYPGSNAMVPKSDGMGYILKTDMSYNNNASIGLVQLSPDGKSECAQRKSIEESEVPVRMTKVRYQPESVDIIELTLAILKVVNQTERISCTNLRPVSQRSVKPSIEEFHSLVAFPSILNESATVLNLEFSAEKESSVVIKVLNEQGQLLSSIKYFSNMGINRVELDPSLFSQGLNTIVLSSSGGKQKITKVIKL